MLDHLLEPDVESSEDLWVEARVEERVIKLQDTMDKTKDLPEWLQDYVDWDAVSKHLDEVFRLQLKEEQFEADVLALEARGG